MRTVIQFAAPDASRWREAAWGSGLLGFALGGFFDGILLHQILQWHHLLSSFDESRLADPAVQILADGIFHALMYLLSVMGLFKLYRARASLCEKPVEHLTVAWAIAGFGIWHIVDSILSHWLLGIHRVRMDVDDRLFWDLLWFAALGIVPLLLGLLLLRHAQRSTSRSSDSRRSGAGPFAIIFLTLAGALLMSFPAPPETRQVAVVLRPGASPAALLNAAHTSDLRLLWASRTGDAWLFAVPDTAPTVRRASLWQAGALYVSGSLTPAGCAAWIDA